MHCMNSVHVPAAKALVNGWRKFQLNSLHICTGFSNYVLWEGCYYFWYYLKLLTSPNLNWLMKMLNSWGENLGMGYLAIPSDLFWLVWNCDPRPFLGLRNWCDWFALWGWDFRHEGIIWALNLGGIFLKNDAACTHLKVATAALWDGPIPFLSEIWSLFYIFRKENKLWFNFGFYGSGPSLGLIMILHESLFKIKGSIHIL